jgi:hypothetical protein
MTNTSNAKISNASVTSDQFRIDAWAVGDGLLFTSRRPARTDIWYELSGPEIETYLVMAPDFDAVPVSRALAFGAVRRGAQEGFSLDGVQEVAFDTLAQVRELARRAYVASGIGEGGPDGGATPQERPPPDSGPQPLFPERLAELSADGGTELAAEVNSLSLNLTGRDQPAARIKLQQALFAAMGERAIEDAAALLLASAEQMLATTLHEFGSVPAARGLLHLAACLVGAEGAWRVADRLLLKPDDMHLTRSMFNHPLAPMYGNGGPGREVCDAMRLLCEGLLPGHSVLAPLSLPSRCQTWMDVMEYLNVDREYFTRSRNGEWLPLAIAVACVATADRISVEPWFGPAENSNRFYQDRWRNRLAEFIAALLPAAGLASDAEAWIRDRCWRYQRPTVL